MTVEVRRIPLGGKLTDFLQVVDRIYQDDPHYVHSMAFEVKGRLSPKHPFWQHAEGVIFTAYRNGQCVGRCTAQIDREHLARHRDDTGFFGFLDTTDDLEVTQALIRDASLWLKERGMRKIRGPLSLSVNDEIGCLIEGFNTPPMVMMPHHRPYQGGLIEQSGLTKLKDLYAWRYFVGDVPARARKATDDVAAMPEVSSRPVDVNNADAEIRTIIDVFNDAWQDNWGFVPYTDAELAKQAKDLKLLLDPRLTLIVTVDGKPAAVALALPNLNEVVRDFKGKITPLNVAKLLWRLKVQGTKTARLAILGIRKEYRYNKRYAGLSTYMYTKLNDSARTMGVDWGELSWTLEDNAPVNVAIKFMGGKVYKKYRVYEAEL